MENINYCFTRLNTNLLSKSFLFLAILFVLQSCGGDGKDYVEQTVEDPTQGIIAEIQEVKTDIFKITNEEIIDKRDDSRIIATFMDGKIDTFTLDEIKLTEHTDPRRSMMRSVALGGMMGFMMGRGMGGGLNRSSYANDKAFNKAGSSTTKLRSTATRKTVRSPKPKSSSGFGKSKSTKSFGG